MFCTNCGANIPEGAKFCGNCGTPATAIEKVSPKKEQNIPEQRLDAPLSVLKGVSKYEGTPVAGYSDATGTLTIYCNRIEFKRKMGSALSSRSGILGLAVSAGLAHTDPIETFDLEQISELRVGKYMGLYNTLVLTLDNDEVWSFCPVMPKSSEPQKIISLLAPYMQK